jgi:hypothetical protein
MAKPMSVSPNQSPIFLGFADDPSSWIGPNTVNTRYNHVLHSLIAMKISEKHSDAIESFMKAIRERGVEIRDQSRFNTEIVSS